MLAGKACYNARRQYGEDRIYQHSGIVIQEELEHMWHLTLHNVFVGFENQKLGAVNMT